MKNEADVDVRLIVPVVESIEVSLTKILNIKIERGKMYVLDIPFTSMGIGTIIDFSGDFKGKIFLDMRPETAMRLAEIYLREKIEKFDELVISTVSEVLNIIGGNISTRIQNYGNIKISVPRIITKFSKNPEYERKKIIIIPLGFEENIINISFYIL